VTVAIPALDVQIPISFKINSHSEMRGI
jgi:hypothetical protein